NLSKKEEGLRDDYEFYKALYANDKARMEEILKKMTSPQFHKKRNDNPILSQYISLPALGYAKLAWRKGIEVEVNSPLIPKELLPIKPLEKYEIPYEFLYSENINPTI
ncbi:MAG: immunity 49 family protein, partial [Bacteroidales bacterium]|nr:immunity 49 family protein [Bacteroidales bacterium]